MQYASNETTFFARLLSRFILIAGLGIVAGLAWYIPATRGADVAAFKNFKIELPELTRIALSIPAMYFPVAAVVTGVLMIAVQVGARGNTASVFHLFAIVLCCIVFQLFQQAMTEPSIVLFRSFVGQVSR